MKALINKIGLTVRDAKDNFGGLAQEYRIICKILNYILIYLYKQVYNARSTFLSSK